MDVLSAAHDKHLQPTSFDFDESIEDEHAIEVLTEKVTKSFKRSQEKIISLGDYKITEDEESVRKNIKSQLATELQDLSVKFRKLQQGYLKKLKSREKNVGKAKQYQEVFDELMDESYDIGFSKDQSQVLQEAEENANQQEKEILQIAKSINELSSIFKDLAILVIEQGTILDRIDYNVEQTVHNMEKGLGEIRQANQSQKSYRNKLCMLLLCICIFVLLIAFIFKFILK